MALVRRFVVLLLCVGALKAQAPVGAVQMPVAVEYDAAGNLYFADAGRHEVFEATLAGQLMVVAGNGTQGYAGDGGAATAAELNSPQGVAVGADGTLYIADTGNNVVRAVANGVIRTVVGSGRAGFSGDGGVATAARLAGPSAVVLDAAAGLLIADSGNHRVRRVAGGVIATIAGSGVQGFGGDGGAATAARFDTPQGLAVASDGRVFVADTHNQRGRVVDTAGVITTFVGMGKAGFAGDGGAATAAELDSPRGLAVDASGVLLIADANNQRVRSVSASGVMTTVAGGAVQGAAGDGAGALAAALNTPRGVATGGFGFVAVADAANHVVRVLAADGRLYLPAALAARSTSVVVTAVSDAAITVAGQVATPQGSVQVVVDGAVFATASLSGGAASVPLGALAPGSHTLVANYLGDGLNPAGVSAAITVGAARASTAVVMQPPSPNDYAGMPLLLKANVTSAAKGTPTGTVSFVESGATVATAQLAGGIASAVYLAPTAGTHLIVASYAGDGSFLAGAAPAVSVTVKPMPDFAVSVSGASSQTVAAGAIATYGLSIAPVDGVFTGAVLLSASGLPKGATVSFAPLQVVPGSGAVGTVMSIQTAAAVASVKGVSVWWGLLCLPLVLLRRRGVMLFGVVMLSGCGARVYVSPKPVVATNYTITVSATGTNLAGAVVVRTTTVTLAIE